MYGIIPQLAEQLIALISIYLSDFFFFYGSLTHWILEFLQKQYKML